MAATRRDWSCGVAADLPGPRGRQEPSASRSRRGGAAALVLLEGTAIVAAAAVPPDGDGQAHKVEGLTITRESDDGIDLLAFVDQDDPALASPVLHLTVTRP